jgi:hypothetical protein
MSRHLVGNEREKADFLPTISVGLDAAHGEAPEAPVYCRQKEARTPNEPRGS